TRPVFIKEWIALIIVNVIELLCISAQGTAMDIDWGQIQVPSGNDSQARRPASSNSQRNEDDPEFIRQMFLNDPHQLSLLKERNPDLADAIVNPEKFAEVLGKQRQEMDNRNVQRIRTMNADMFDAEAQREIAEEIRMSNVNQNMEAAMEYSPESFARVIMLYINCTLNGHPVKAFVDSGAQMTFMSSACAERCHITRLIDQRWSGIAQGVGQQKIIGRVHVAQIQIENDFLQSSFSVLHDQVMDLVLGLDMLKRHQCCIDLKDNVLVIGTTGTRTLFLPESELPSNARLSTNDPETSSPEIEDRNLAEALARSAEDGASTSSIQPPQAQPSVVTGRSDFPEEKILQITKMGFTREEAVQELRRCNGDCNLAAASLLAKSLKVPPR
ncbi:hypothetical protein QZH41_011547, partial [Actinostola sp. cb2023]